jgi:SAM-dependent methyltransferase
MTKKNEIYPNQENFWDKRAKLFPRYNTIEDSYENRVLGLIKEGGIDFKDKKVLDVGCGAGMFTIKIAKMACKVTALDISSEMLKILKFDAEKYDVFNIDYVHKDFLNFESKEQHDIIYCSLSPAVTNEFGKEKLLSLKGAIVVFIGNTEAMRSNIIDGLCKHYKITPSPFTTAITMKIFLEIQNVPYKIIPLEGIWRVKFSKDDIEDSVTKTMDNLGVKIDKEYLEGYLKNFLEEDGLYLETTDYKLAIIIWQNP